MKSIILGLLLKSSLPWWGKKKVMWNKYKRNIGNKTNFKYYGQYYEHILYSKTSRSTLLQYMLHHIMNIYMSIYYEQYDHHIYVHIYVYTWTIL